ncbi:MULTISPECIES: DNA cytosine methyltransferase [Cryobacterium]|uniref:DNA cytosine methyltransferase n=1 Tax=Cryobacterium TaxID=69578 RepID=UPI000CD47C8F|nr:MULTISPECIES: DNA cytosine methyltransferase [Cryobacterium]POH63622.1 DNA (cytosine-5-)-methyltransferase [Cryobacterium zongtaii]TFC45589.1 DNA cytosine methyltransferase [Cryobacterium sp. TMN-39-2]
MPSALASISAIDLFCGAGGLSQGLQEAGISVVGGVDIDASCSYAFEANIDAPFIERDVREITAEHLEPLWTPGSIRMLAGCAPCQPFSPYRRGVDTSAEAQWPLLREFSRLVKDISPELVTMENVPRIGTSAVFQEFVNDLKALGYFVDWKSCYGPRFGLPQHRRRLVLLASRLGPIKVPDGSLDEANFRTVREVIGGLPKLASGEADGKDPLHVARNLSPLNLRRIAASAPGGTWQDWPEELLSPCHRKASGSSFKNVYARMEWDKPSPTITTMSGNFGAGRFGHPEQDRSITLREAALLQGFPPGYKLVKSDVRVNQSQIARLIGNAVPPPIAAEVGRAAVAHIAAQLTAAK